MQLFERTTRRVELSTVGRGFVPKARNVLNELESALIGNRFLIDQALAHRDVRPRSFCEVKHVPALVSVVEAGLGIGVVPKLAMPASGHATLVTRPLTDPSISRTLGLISRRGRALSPVAQLLFDLLITFDSSAAVAKRLESGLSQSADHQVSARLGLWRVTVLAVCH